MDKFLELSFRNHLRNNDKIADEFFVILEPLLIEIKKYLSEEIAQKIEESIFLAVASDALEYAGVEGMKLAIGVMNETIKQVIE